MANEVGITINKEENMPEWYSQVVLKSELADYSVVKGCAVIRPLGYALWQSIMDNFNATMKKLKVQNAYFPMLIPESLFLKEAEHVEGFAPEVAWIEKKEDSEERLAIRPTSETIMYDSYSKWIRSHRDLPLRINQWANIVRWEVSDVKMFLRSREFLWQEGHCVYATEEECDKEAFIMIQEYKNLVEGLLAVPAFIGKKSENDKFPGAVTTYTIETIMPDGKALQSGTSHNLGQGFGKVFNINYQGEDGKQHVPWQSSWGFSTRLLGALIMTHSDNKGLVIPPKMAPIKAVIVPIMLKKKPEITEKVLDKAYELKKQLEDLGIDVNVDARNDKSPGFKYSEWELKGVPARIELGPRDLENDSCVMVMRNKGEKEIVPLSDVHTKLPNNLELMQKELYDTAKEKVESNRVKVDNYEDFKQAIEEKKWIETCHCGDADCEDAIKEETRATTRVRLHGEEKADDGDVCVKCGKKAAYKIIFSKNY